MVEAFIWTAAPGNREIADLIQHLSFCGEVAIFGGMLRDFARGGPSFFNSDVDLVVDADASKLDARLNGLPVTRNRFGGYRLKGRHFEFDIWALPSTWAVREGLVSIRHLADLRATTFFDCDAILYNCCSHTIEWHDGYLDRLRERVVEINLKDNPNRVGVLARTLRVLFDWGYGLGPNLTVYLLDGLQDCEEEIHAYCKRLPSYTVWSRQRLRRLRSQLEHHISGEGNLAFGSSGVLADIGSEY